MSTDQQRATLAAVAREARVSLSTVSKVVNERTDVAPETRARVAALLKRHGYVRRQQAAPAGVRSVDLVFDGMETPNNLKILKGAIDAAAEENVDVVVGLAPARPHSAHRAGIVLVTSSITAEQWQHFTRRGVPIVTIDPHDVPSAEVPSVGATNFQGGMEATAHLTGLGHRRIAFIEGPPERGVSIARLHGYRAALSQAGVEHDPGLVQAGPFTFDAGFAAGTALLSSANRPTAIFACNDTLALGAMEAARTLGLRIPSDVSVIGFDDMPVTQWSAPPLTTVRQPFSQMGRVAMRRLLRLAAGERLESPRIELATELIVRKSTSKLSSID
ncbi:substrate-binding domain-containing protein [Actinoplanes sp. NPDC048796]|uniref:LacI family DNA-binding transcriptional regulator n=1 Tax=unclassified Actinoplanes TaxID=2626549 RepID=UPI003406064F